MKHRYALLALFLPGTALAQSPADVERITTLAQDFEVATETADMEASLNIMPPRLIDSIASQMNVTREEYMGHMVQAARQAAGLMNVQDVVIDVGKLSWHTAPDGMAYGLIPTRSIVEVKDAPGAPQARVIVEDSQTMALRDGGDWYLVRLGSLRQQDMLREAFPGLAEIDLPLPDAREVQQ